MKLSVIIVNYNVSYFLEQCLNSVKDASKGIDTEVFVVDNHSVDNSVSMLREKFPEVKLIVNEKNVGFAKANNQAISLSRGEYVLLLNPDTVVESDTFSKTLDFMDKTSDAGALGVKMIDGQGRYLPESKRGLPLPDVAFYKVFGLSKIFKKSKRFGRYHLTYLDPDKIHSVDVLPGAFMLLRKKTLDEIGYLDETFFMYGEDIDLSYRVTLGGYKNYYYPLTRIIHYKGESTKKSSINYVIVFYQAMQIFVKKHFSKKNAKLFDIVINFAIWLRASVSIIKRVFLKILMPILDFLIIYAGLFAISWYWETSVLFVRGGTFPDIFKYGVLPLYALIWICCIRLQNAYRPPVSIKRVNQGILLGSIVILLVYSLLNEHFRFSRAVILLGSVYVFLILNLLRCFVGKLDFKNYPIEEMQVKRLIIVGKEKEAERVSNLLKMTSFKQILLGYVNPSDEKIENNPTYIGNLDNIQDIIEFFRIGEVIFCGADISAKEIMTTMSKLQDFNLEYKIAPPKSMYIIGSNSINVEGDIYTMSVNSIGKRENQRRKRMFDIMMSIALTIFSPFIIWFIKCKSCFYSHIAEVLKGEKTWVGYNTRQQSESKFLPKIKDGILFTTSALSDKNLNQEIIWQFNGLYAKDYRVLTDFKIVFKCLKKLGET